MTHANDALRQQFQRHLANHEPTRATAERRAAVALIVVEGGHGADLPGLPHYNHWHTKPALVLTRRAATLKRHAGQWALPGGRIDANETALQAAVRESMEEISLTLTNDSLLGVLDDYVTRSGFVMTPYVFWPATEPTMQADPTEVASIHRIPLTELQRPDSPMLDAIESGNPDRPVLRMPMGDNWVAAPTAAILYQFSEVCLYGRHTRVAHFDQPAFAWR